jgi:hypothetical protein
MAIQAIDIDHPPGIGIAPDMMAALRTVMTQAVMVMTPAIDSKSQLSRVMF